VVIAFVPAAAAPHNATFPNGGHFTASLLVMSYTRVYPKVSGLTAWSENCKWYSSLPP
jgi:hypothetical protein